MPNRKLVQLLDSVAFVEAASPDRDSGTRQYSLRTESLRRTRRYQPNLVWIKIIAEIPLGSDAARQHRNALLYKVSAALQDSALLRQLQLSAAELRLAHQLIWQPNFAQVPLQLALSDLATALAHAGRGAEAWAFARRLPAPFPTITAIRVGEQAMLRNDHSQQAALDSFLTVYQRSVVKHPTKAANSIIPLLYWQPHEASQQAKSFRSFATLLMQEGRPETYQTGPVGMCRGRSLADHSYQAQRDVPTYQAERLRQSCFTAILAGLAHRRTGQSGDGWREYDEKVLTTVANYDGPAN